MDKKQYFLCAAAGAGAGIVSGLLGAGGGMLLIPLLSLFVHPPEDKLFPLCVSIMLPICVVSLLYGQDIAALPWQEAWPYLLGGAVGGALAGATGHRIPVAWLHRVLGVFILWGGIRSLCP